MAPALTGSEPEMRLNSVVFPAPFGPMRARRSPGRTASDTPPTACSPPKYLETPSSLRAKSALTTPPPHPALSPSRGRGMWRRACETNPSPLWGEGRVRGRLLAVLARGVIARVEGLLQELLRV